ncbi:MAG: radical SAM/SPASM domain-containing protein [Candidatus Brocadiales bacterium]
MLGLNGYRKNLGLIKEAVVNGGPSFINFALTNACNAKCSFCSFPDIASKDWVFVDTDRAKEALDILYGRGVRYITYVGGEPLLHPGFFDIISYSVDKGIVSMMSTNGVYLTPENIRAMKDSGLSTIFISIDATSVEEHEKNRGLPGVCKTIQKAMPQIKESGLNPIVSVTISRLIKDYTKLPDFLKELGFSKLTFSYPMMRYADSYAGSNPTTLIDYTPEEIIQVLNDIKALKAQLNVVNPTAAIDDMIRFFNGEGARFLCLGGYKSFYVDWLLDVYPCQTLNQKMGNIYEFVDVPFKRLNCNLCINECYREPSLMQYVAISVSDAGSAFRKGRIREGLGKLWDRNNLTSLWASIEEWRDAGRI